VVSAWHSRLPNPLALLAARVADDHPQVRLEAVRALAQVPTVRAVELALSALDRPVDPFLDYALWLTAREREAEWLPALQQGRLDFGGNARRLVFALQAIEARGAIQPLMNLVKAGKVPPEGEESVLTLLAAVGGSQELGPVFDRAVSGSTSTATRVKLLKALAQATQQRGVRPAGDLGRLTPWLESPVEAVRAAAARLGGLWKMEQVRPHLLGLVQATGTSDDLRQAAVEGLGALGGKASRDTFEQLAAADGPPAVRRMALIALAGLDLPAAAKHAVDVLSVSQGGENAPDIFEAFLQRKNGAALLATALTGRKLPPDVAKVGVRTVRISGRDAPALLEALSKAGGLTFGARTLTPKEMQEMVRDVTRLGDAARGEAVFRRKDQLCLKCHAIAGAGGQVGPDLGSIGASAQIDYLIESLLEPNKAIKENYHAVLVSTSTGRYYTGIKVRQTKTELVLRSAEDKEIAIPLKDVDEQTPGRSLMPDGLTDTLTRGELLDLVRFLSELGKVGLYSISRAKVVRRWQALEPTRDAYRLLATTGYGAAASNDPALTWAPAYSTVAGGLPLNDVPHLRFGTDKHGIAVVCCQLDVAAAGTIRLRFNSVKGLSLWLDQQPVGVTDVLELHPSVGLHTLTFVIDRGERRDELRCELEDQPGSPARAHVVGGK
jgi:putative heme-binding domain-containing protein